MAGRIRSIKPEWLADERLAAASSDARVLSIGLILLADDYGNGRGGALYIASQVFPGQHIDNAICALAELERVAFCSLYQHDGQTYFTIRNWAKHQRVDRPGKALVPGPGGELRPSSRSTGGPTGEACSPGAATRRQGPAGESAHRGRPGAVATPSESPASIPEPRTSSPPESVPDSTAATLPRHCRDTAATDRDLDLDLDLDQDPDRERDQRGQARARPDTDATPTPPATSAASAAPSPNSNTNGSGESPARLVFEAWLEGWRRHGTGDEPRWTDGRRKLLRARLREHPLDQLVAAVRGLWRSSWDVERGLTSIEHALKDAAHVEKFASLEAASKPKPRPKREPKPVEPAPPTLSLDEARAQAKAAMARLEQEMGHR